MLKSNYGPYYGIDFTKLPLQKAKELAKVLISTTIKMQEFLKGYELKGKTCGNGINIITIRKDGETSKEKEIKKFEVDLSVD